MTSIYIICISLFIVLLDQCFGTRVLRRHAGFSDDLPVREDIQIYLNSLRKMIEFTGDNKLDLDLNYVFGIFMLQVHLKAAIKSKNSLRKPVSNDIESLLKENEKLLKYFKFRVDTDFNEQYISEKSIAKLFSNCKTWSVRIPTLKLTDQPPSRRNQYTSTYFRWPNYRDNVQKYHRGTPNPAQSDYCLSVLGDHNDLMNYNHQCDVPDSCRNMLINGTDFGYSLLHRLLFLQGARYGRGCSIFSPVYDNILRNKFCSMAYGEAERIVQHDFDGLDLLFEQVCLCSLDGHVEFLHRFWLKKLLEKQSSLGCFGREPHVTNITFTEADKYKTWKIMKTNHQLLGGHCDGHFTAVAAASLGAAVRLILENY